MAKQPSRKKLTKSILNADFGTRTNSAALGAVSFEAIKSHQKDLTPREQYELSPIVNACINAIARNISQAHIRIFDKSGREVVGGDLFNLIRKPAKGLTTRTWLWNTVAWFNIAGELMARIGEPGPSGFPETLLPLDPFNCYPTKPTNPATSDDVVQWTYYYKNGHSELIRSDYLLYQKMFNPMSDVRGCSPLNTGSTEIATGYHLSRYNKSFFENSAIPSHLLMLGDGVGTQQRRDIEERYKSEFAAYNGNAHKVMVVSGKNAKVETLEQPFQDGSFMELRKSVLQAVAMIYRVPAIEAGLYDKTRFDTAAEERKLFVEGTLKPQCDVISDMLQFQLVDQHFRFSSVQRERQGFEKAKFTKSLSDAYDRAIYEREGSELIVLVDIDTLPVMSSVKASMISLAKDMKETLDMSASEVANYFHIDIPDREERDDIWKNRSYINISDPDMNRQLLEGELRAKQEINATANPNNPENESGKPDNKEDKSEAKKAIKTLLSKIRKPTFEAIDNGRLWSLDEADQLAGDDDILKKSVRLIRHKLRDVLKSDDPASTAKLILNSINPNELAEVLV